jgi:hypothetical protein
VVRRHIQKHFEHVIAVRHHCSNQQYPNCNTHGDLKSNAEDGADKANNKKQPPTELFLIK